MASEHFLRKVIEIQNIVLEEKANGRSQLWIYENIIRDRYFIAKATFDRYLSINAKLELTNKHLSYETT